MKAKETLQSKEKKQKRDTLKTDVKHGISAPKAGVGRPSSGEVIGILPQYRKEVIKDIILWKKSRYFIEEKPTSNKALAQWAYSHFDFRTPDYKRLSENTIIQEFGEVWREMKVAGKI